MLKHSIHALTFRIPYFLTIDKEGESQLIDDQRFIEQLQTGQIHNHIIISLNDIMSMVEGLASSVEFGEFVDLSKEELELLTIVRHRKASLLD